MIPIKRCNYITGDVSDIGYGVSRIVRFLELDGANYLLLGSGKPKDSSKTTSLYSYLDNQFTFSNLEEFSEIINNDSNLFRVNLLVFDFWHIPKDLIYQYKKEIDKLNIDHIIVAKEYYYKSTDNVTDYHLRREFKSNINNLSPTDLKSQIIITDNINKWVSDLDSLVKSYVRDKKINNIFGNKIK